YVDAIANHDISRVDNVNRSPDFAKRLLRSYARHQGGQVSVKTIFDDLETNEAGSMNEDTIAFYNEISPLFDGSYRLGAICLQTK
ncbi:MAG: hypothetical protein LBJ72_08700, partial [Dysgonamonadaceae bacterium]|nr:hypothetical protein [Dysgonamonadaceae bacterium]